MVYTVTLNPAIDHTVYIDEFKIGGLNRIEHCIYDVGGKGINVSKALNAFGIENKAITIIGGKNGDILKSKCSELGLTLLCWDNKGETRINTKIVDASSLVTTELNESGPTVSQEILDNIIESLVSSTKEKDIVVLTGSLPKDVSPYIYSEWSDRLAGKGIKVFLDASGEALQHGLKSNVYAVKPNLVELEQFYNEKFNNTEDIINAGKKLLSGNTRKVVVSLGKEGAFYFEEGSAFYLAPIDVPVNSTVGAGDAMIAALIYAEIMNKTPEQTAKLAVAAASASVMCQGTETPSLDVIKELLGRATVSNV